MGFWNWNISPGSRGGHTEESSSFDLAKELGLTQEELEKVKTFATQNGKTKEKYVTAGAVRLYDPWNNDGYAKPMTDLQVQRRWNQQSLKDFAAMALREENT